MERNQPQSKFPSPFKGQVNIACYRASCIHKREKKLLILDIYPEQKYGKEFSFIGDGKTYRSFYSCKYLRRHIDLYIDFRKVASPKKA